MNADQSHDHTVPHQRSGTYDLSGTTVVVTGGNAGADPKFMKAATARIPLRRCATADDYLDTAPFLAHTGLTYHTGNEVVVDGAYSVF